VTFHIMAAAVASRSQETSMQSKKTARLTGEECLALAQKQRGLGQNQEALASFEKAWRHFIAVEISGCKAGQKLWTRAATGLGYADVALDVGKWLLLEGTSVEEILDASLEAAHQASKQKNQTRSRELEGQILLLKSKALFAKPHKKAQDLDSATEARFAAMDLLEEAAVDALPWSRAQLQDALDKPRGDPTNPLTSESLTMQLAELWPDSFKQIDLTIYESVGFLFEFWAVEDVLIGKEVISLHEYLTRFLKVAKRFERKVDAEACSDHALEMNVDAEACSDHAPCTGNFPTDREYSEVEKELVMMVSRDGAGDWSSKAEQMQKAGMKDVTAYKLMMLWKQLAPVLKKSISSDEQMACGHSCSTCPSRETCQVHDAVKDIEDL
jgi:hypothetical protein